MAVKIEQEAIIDCAKKAAGSTHGIHTIDEKTAQDWAKQFAASPHTHSEKGREAGIRTRFEERFAQLLRMASRSVRESSDDDNTGRISLSEKALPYLKGPLHTVISPRDRFSGPWTKETFLVTENPGETLADLVERITPEIVKGEIPLIDSGGNPIPLRRTTRRKIQKSASQGVALRS